MPGTHAAGPGWAPSPGRDECHVWAVMLTEVEPLPGDLLRLLRPDEQARADRYRVAIARRIFLVSAVLQRVLAARYLGCQPADIAIIRSCEHCGDEAHGRPRLAGHHGLDFSVAHTGELVVLAYVSEGRVGVDAEVASGNIRIEQLGDLVFTPAEAEQVSAAPADSRMAVFQRLWTRKEAVVKLTGHGLAMPLNGFDVTDGDRVRVPAPPPGWPAEPIGLTDLALGGGYVVAVATTGARRRVTVRSPVPIAGNRGHDADPGSPA